MAEALFNELAEGRFRAISAGTEPASHPHPEVVAAMRKRGIELEERPGALLTDQMTERATKVVGMGCNVQEACPALRTPLEDWALEDPKGKPPEQVAAIRDHIEARVRALISELDRETGS